MNQIAENYIQMKKIINRYHESASIDSQIPTRWYVIGIEEWLRDFENQVEKLDESDSSKNILMENLKDERKKLIQLRVRAIVNGEKIYDLEEEGK